MNRKMVFIGTILFWTVTCMASTDIKFVQDTNKIDILIGGKLFTAYQYGSELTKPILYPVNSPSGILLTRHFPFEIIKGESNDHPHHMGIFFAYDKVNTDGFWNNTTSPPQIKHIKVTKMENGELSTTSHWVGKSGKTLLEEKRDMIFSWDGLGARETTAKMAVPLLNEYTIDFNITLSAQDEKVVFGDTKEGMFAMRVADWLSEEKGTGRYLAADGNVGEPNIWGRKGTWVRLEGTKDGKTIGIAIFNHPTSACFPTYWHARGYGLFGADPLGQLDFLTARKIPNAQPLNFTLQPGQSALFKFRMIIYEGPKSAENLEKEFQGFAKK
jgi:hypothetical protein